VKIEIEIDIESIVREEIREYVKNNIVIHNTTGGIVLPGEPALEAPNGAPLVVSNEIIEWEFSPKPGRRRSKEEIALHELELKHNRLLTPEEKGVAKAAVEIDETTESKAKEGAINKDRIDKMANEGMNAASKEIAEEESKSPKEEYSNPTQTEEATIPKADDIDLNSMFE
jgi:hypothetical protein